MKARKYSAVPLLVGLALALMATWAASAPVGVAGDLITGGFTGCIIEDDYPVACTGGPCTYCDGDYNTSCSNWEGGDTCFGGPITVVSCSSAGDATGTSHKVGYACTGTGICTLLRNGSCY